MKMLEIKIQIGRTLDMNVNPKELFDECKTE